MKVSRRIFLKGGGVAMIGMSTIPAFLQRAVAATAMPNKKKLIVLFQRGAADGLNIVATRLETLDACAGPRLLTPHPGEMARLAPDSKNQARRQTVEAFTKAHPVTLLLKGARTVIGEKGRPLAYNTTGNPGMASGGMGDVLTGVCAALAGQGLSLYDAAQIANH